MTLSRCCRLAADRLHQDVAGPADLFSIVAIYVIPLLRPVPLFCAETLARVAAERRWVLAVYLITVFIVMPALVIVFVGVL
jgi:sodium-dependent phosphate cotransporter